MLLSSQQMVSLRCKYDVLANIHNMSEFTANINIVHLLYVYALSSRNYMYYIDILLKLYMFTMHLNSTPS